uniref:C-C motif chemokine receptor 8 n=1 Tax=Rhinolophus ferrumequinum TaxID=59479 RepID=A0A671FUK5_RHIFE
MDYTLEPNVTITDYYYPDIISSPCDGELIQKGNSLSALPVGVWGCNVQGGVWLLLHWLLQQHVLYHPHEHRQVPGNCPCCVCHESEDSQTGHSPEPGSMADRHHGHQPTAGILPSGL